MLSAFSFSLLDDDRVDDAFAVLQSVGRWLESRGRRQRISKTTRASYLQWQSEKANFVVQEAGEIVGLVTLRRESLVDWPAHAERGPVWMLRGLATHPGHRNRGIGALAVRQAVELANSKDVYLDCVSDFLPDYYQQLGFEKIDQQHRSDSDNDSFDITLMRYRCD
jgi:predicted N-acetyltransferase YhbS